MTGDSQINREPLLRNEYFSDCPGCKVEQYKDLQRGFPIKDIIRIWIIVLANALPITSLFPFLYFMIRDLHIAKREEGVAYYAGYVGAAYMLGRALTSVLWGVIADRLGRKPVIIIGTVTVVVFNTLFGLSVNYWMAISTRFLLGSFNGLLGTMKDTDGSQHHLLIKSGFRSIESTYETHLLLLMVLTAMSYACEIFREEYQALGMSTISTAWGIGLIIGPAIGGFFAQPADKYPSIFSKTSFFGRFPYFLPCFCISAFSMGVMILSFWLPETLHKHNGKQRSRSDSFDALETAHFPTDANESRENTEGDQKSKKSLLKNWPLMSSIIAYCVFSLQDMAYTEIFSLWAVSPRKFGGLNYTTDTVGEVLAISGFSLVTFQLFLYPFLEKMFGAILVCRITAILNIPLLVGYPFLASLSGLTLFLVLTVASVARNALTVSLLTGLDILQNRAVDQDQRGAANGLSTTGMSVFKAVGPAGAGALFSWAEKRRDASFLPGTHMVFFILNVVQTIGVLLTFKPFLTTRQKWLG